MAPRSWDLVVLLAGALTPLGFAPFGLWLLPIPCLGVLLWVLPFGTIRRSFWRGWLFGLGMFGTGTSWVVESFQHSNVALPSALILTATMVGFLAIFPALFATVSRFCSGNRRGAISLITLPAAWVLAEWGRGTVLTGFSFLQLGYSQIDSPVSALAPVAGVYGASWAVAFSAAVLVWGFSHTAVHVVKALAVVLACWGSLWVAQDLRWTEFDGTQLDVAIVQGNIPQALKWRPEYRQRSFDIYRDYTRKHWDADLIVWPETALPGMYDSFSSELSALEREAVANNTELLIGVPSSQETVGGQYRYFNSVVSVGSSRAIYNKRHLVPFGEFVPRQRLFQPLIDLFDWPVSNFSHGQPAQTTINVAGQIIGISICFEIAFGKDIIAALPSAGLLVNVSNDAWFGESIGPHQHLQMARWRAKEAGRFLVRATNTGVSAFVQPSGQLAGVLPQFAETSASRRVDIMRGATPYALSGDLPVLALLLLILVVAAYVQRTRLPSIRESNIS